MRLGLILTVLLLGTLVAPAAAPARLLVGIGDQHPASYQDKQMKRLGLKTARLALAWDWYKNPAVIAGTDQWVAAVRRARMRPLITFNRNWRRSGRKQIPPVNSYVRSFRLLRERYPHVREFSPWNEPNAAEQPFARKPALAARYFNAMRRVCRSCTVLAGDVKDGASMIPWLSVYKRKVKGAKVWALHNYKDTTRGRGGTLAFLASVKGPVWLTETGGLRNRGGLKGQAQAVRRTFAIARSSRRIRRLYFYQWRAVRDSHWDSAFLAANGKRRPAYFALRTGLRAR
jgi:hypothetical protein